MKKLKSWFLPLLTMLFLSGCTGLYSNCIVGSGNVVSKDYAVDEFHSVDYAGAGNVYITQATPQSLIIEAEDNVLEQLVVTVSNKNLKIYSKRCFTNIRPINVYVSMKEVRDLTGSGSVNFVSRSEIDADTLKLSIIGSGSFDLTLDANELNTVISGSGKSSLKGTAKAHNAEIIGSGSILASDLATQTTDITISGSGKAEVDASQELDINIAGSGNVFYTGDATVTQTVSGSGKIQKR